MKENIKLTAKITGKTALKWVFIFAMGNLITLITFLIALYRNMEIAGGGHGSIIALGIGLVTTNFFAFLLVFGAPVFIILYFIIANKISIQNAIYLLWEGKLGDYISSKVGNMTRTLTQKEGWKKELSDKADVDNSKLQRKFINFGLKKIKLDDVNFQDKNVDLSHIITEKFNNFISETVKPSLKLFWGLVLIQIVLLISSILIN